LKAWLFSYEFGGIYIEGFRELADGTEMRLSMIALDISNRTRTNARLLGQLLLREKPPNAGLSQPISDVDHGGHCSLLLLTNIV